MMVVAKMITLVAPTLMVATVLLLLLALPRAAGAPAAVPFTTGTHHPIPRGTALGPHPQSGKPSLYHP